MKISEETKIVLLDWAAYFCSFLAISLLSFVFAEEMAHGQNPVVPFRSPRVTFQTATGQPLSGGCIYTYQGGTTTPQATYMDSTGSTPNTNPVVLDTTGSAVMWLGANSYKFAAYSAGGFHCSSGSLQWTVDQVPGNAFLNGTITGDTITNPTITGGTDSGTSVSSAVITASSINGSAIGSTTPASGAFTSLSSTMNAMSFSSTPVFNAASYGYFTMTLTGNVTSSTITGGSVGQQITIQVCQDNSGAHTFAWPANLQNAPFVNPLLQSCTIDVAFFNGANWVTVAGYPIVPPNPNVPTVALGAAAGAGASLVTAQGNDFSGFISFQTGTSPLTSGTLFTITYSGFYSPLVNCIVVLQSGGVTGSVNVGAMSAAHVQTYTQGSPALTASTSYLATYLCHQ